MIILTKMTPFCMILLRMFLEEETQPPLITLFKILFTHVLVQQQN